jgi:hypothetical protein
METFQRTQAHVEEEYKVTWSLVSNFLDELETAGERDLSQIMHGLMRLMLNDTRNPRRREIKEMKELELRRNGVIVESRVCRFDHLPLFEVDAILHRMRRAVVREYLHPGIQRVVELGGGAGLNLFNLWLEGAPSSAAYHLLDLSKTGLAVGDRISRLTGLTGFHIQPFNFYEPEFHFTDNVPTVVLTHYSIEQIPKISGYLFEAIMEIPGFETCIHIEPVGFQMPNDDAMPDEQKRLFTALDKFNREWVESVDFNRNLHEVLCDLEARDVIEITTKLKNFAGHMRNVASVIAWKKHAH